MSSRLYRLLPLLLVLLGCARTPTREAALDALVVQQVAPDLRALEGACRTLETHAATLARAPSEATVEAARGAWRAALIAWQRVHAFHEGPLDETRALVRAHFWPLRVPALEVLVQSDRPVDDAHIAQLGVDVRGMFALEWLLFDARTAPALHAHGPEGVRVRALVQALSRDVAQHAARAHGALGGAAFATRFAEGGQESLSRLVNDLAATVERLASERLAPVLEQHARKRLRASDVQGARSGLSTEIVRTQLAAIEQLYTGAQPSLSTLAQAAAPGIDTRVRGRFSKVRGLVARLDAPLEQLVMRDRARVMEAFRAVKELEVALKVDLASALGVTLTFTSADGD